MTRPVDQQQDDEAMRAAARLAFVTRSLGGDDRSGITLEPLVADASFRRYFRLRGEGRPLMLMDAPPAHEDLPAYLRVAGYLHAHGFAAPEILASDTDQGFALIEDFGDRTYTRLLADEPVSAPAPDEVALYRLAVEVLAALHRAAPPSPSPETGFRPYDLAALLDEAALFPDWYWRHVTGREATAGQRQAFLDLMAAAIGETGTRRDCLVLRDYHVDNLMLREGHPAGGLTGCGLLDFQDALVGARPYDLMSLLEDARRDLDPGLVAAMRAHYLALCPPEDPVAFARDYRVLAATRHAKVLGIFVRLSRRDGKPRYLTHLPRVARLFAGALSAPQVAPADDALTRLCALLDTDCPGWRQPAPSARD